MRFFDSEGLTFDGFIEACVSFLNYISSLD